jgi:hypothetical protein
MIVIYIRILVVVCDFFFNLGCLTEILDNYCYDFRNGSKRPHPKLYWTITVYDLLKTQEMAENENE